MAKSFKVNELVYPFVFHSTPVSRKTNIRLGNVMGTIVIVKDAKHAKPTRARIINIKPN